MKILGKLTCWATGHLRRKRVPQDHRALLPESTAVFECPRCGDRETRKVKVKP